MASIRRCRRCDELFVPSLFGINLLVVRIRRCSVCSKLTPLYVWGDSPADQKEEKQEEEIVVDEEELLRRRIEESKYAKP